MKHFFVKYFVIAILIVVSSCQSNAPVDAFQILADYSTDESKANNTYLDQELTVDVPVQVMIPLFDGGFKIVVNGKEGTTQLEFRVPKENIDQFKAINTNTWIRIKGTCVDAGGERNIVFNNCSIVL